MLLRTRFTILKFESLYLTMWNPYEDLDEDGNWIPPTPQPAFDDRADWLRMAAILFLVIVGGKLYINHHPELTVGHNQQEQVAPQSK
jgi:hypothetical protein